MQTSIIEQFLSTKEGREAEEILRSCVHCGFCTATCPTYQLLGDELDGPRGRIYLIKQLLEGSAVTAETQKHLDRCLVCRACETTCPSGVRYHRLLEIGRSFVDAQVPRPLSQSLQRNLLNRLLPDRPKFEVALRGSQHLRPLLPKAVRRLIPKRADAPVPDRTTSSHERTMLILEGCVQPGLNPRINAAATRLVAHLGITLTHAPDAGCCGAINLHSGETGQSLTQMRRNIDAWWPYVEQGAEAIIITASGCGSLVKEYGERLKDDPDYAARAAQISAMAHDLCEVAMGAGSALERLPPLPQPKRVAVHTPCSLQHGQKLDGIIQRILEKRGYHLTEIRDGHLCCGSAGTYSLTQRPLAQQLRRQKLAALTGDQPEVIVTANIGCQCHLQAEAPVPVLHWVELLAADMG